MTVSKEQRVALRDWLTIAAFIASALWVTWEFVWNQGFKTYFETSYLRANINLEHAATLDQTFEPTARPVLIRLSVENPSKRLVRVLSGQVEIYADRLVAVNEVDFMPDKLAETLNRDRAVILRHWMRGKSDLILAGTVFSKWTFAPGEKQEFTRLVWVPNNVYDQLEANIYIKSTHNKDDICLKHTVDAQFRTSTLPGKLVDDSCKELPTGSKEAEVVYDAISVSDSTAYLALPKVQVSSSLSK